MLIKIKIIYHYIELFILNLYKNALENIDFQSIKYWNDIFMIELNDEIISCLKNTSLIRLDRREGWLWNLSYRHACLNMYMNIAL